MTLMGGETATTIGETTARQDWIATRNLRARLESDACPVDVDE